MPSKPGTHLKVHPSIYQLQQPPKGYVPLRLLTSLSGCYIIIGARGVSLSTLHTGHFNQAAKPSSLLSCPQCSWPLGVTKRSRFLRKQGCPKVQSLTYNIWTNNAMFVSPEKIGYVEAGSSKPLGLGLGPNPVPRSDGVLQLHSRIPECC